MQGFSQAHKPLLTHTHSLCCSLGCPEGRDPMERTREGVGSSRAGGPWPPRWAPPPGCRPPSQPLFPCLHFVPCTQMKSQETPSALLPSAFTHSLQLECASLPPHQQTPPLQSRSAFSNSMQPSRTSALFWPSGVPCSFPSMGSGMPSSTTTGMWSTGNHC